MPNIESAIKRVRTSENANVKNSSQTSAMRTAIKKFEDAVASGADNVDALYKEAVKAIDMAESKGLIHKNKANRDKSRLSKKSLNKRIGFGRFFYLSRTKTNDLPACFALVFLLIDFLTTALCAKRIVENLILFRFVPF